MNRNQLKWEKKNLFKNNLRVICCQWERKGKTEKEAYKAD